MKVLLIRPPHTYFGIIGSRKSQITSIGLPLALLYIGAVLEKNGHIVTIYDSLLENPKARMIENKVHFGSDWREIKNFITACNPDFVGITNQFTEQMKSAIRVAQIVKKVNKKIVTVVGGNHSTVAGSDFLQKDMGMDISVQGEGEYTMLDIVNNKPLGDIKGITYLYKGKIIQNLRREWISNLDELPLPAYHLVDMERYFNIVRMGMDTRPDQFAESNRQISVITSRGCPYNCVFCSIKLHMGQSWRAHSSKNVLNHLEILGRKFGVKHIHFEDDNITVDPKRFDKILDGMELLRCNGIKFTWDTPNGVRLDTLNKELLIKMKRNGLTRLKIAIESGDQYTLDNIIRKRHKLEDAIKVAQWCKELKIPLASFYVIGFPGEKKENIERSLKFALMMKKKYKVRPHVGIALPYIGTDLWNICKKNGYMTVEKPWQDGVEFDVFGQAIIKTKDFTPEEIKKYIHDFYRKVALTYVTDIITNPEIIFVLLKMIIKNPRMVKRILNSAIGYLK